MIYIYFWRLGPKFRDKPLFQFSNEDTTQNSKVILLPFILAEQEKDELDEWIYASDDNVDIFGAYTFISTAKGKVYFPDEILDETRLILCMNKVVQEIATEEEKYDLAACLQKEG